MRRASGMVGGVLIVAVVATAGARSNLKDERTTEVKQGEVRSVDFEAPKQEQQVTVEISSPGAPVNAYLVLAKDRRVAERAVGGVRQRALLELQPDAAVKVFVHASGILQKMEVRDLEEVKEGAVLAGFVDRALEDELRRAETNYKIALREVELLTRKLNELQDPAEKKRVERERVEKLAEQERYRSEHQLLAKKQKALTLTAPRSGRVIGLPAKDEIGKFWDKDQRTPFCTIGDLTKLRALVPITPDQYALLKESQEYLRRQKPPTELEATVRVLGRDRDTWQGKLGPLPPSEVKDVPIQLTKRAGGPIATKPGPPGGPSVPLAPLYLISVNFADPNATVYPGTMGEVKIDCARVLPCLLDAKENIESGTLQATIPADSGFVVLLTSTGSRSAQVKLKARGK